MHHKGKNDSVATFEKINTAFSLWLGHSLESAEARHWIARLRADAIQGVSVSIRVSDLLFSTFLWGKFKLQSSLTKQVFVFKLRCYSCLASFSSLRFHSLSKTISSGVGYSDSRVPPHERLLKRAGIYVDQSQRTSKFWKCCLDPEKFCVRSLQENGHRVIAIVIKKKAERINFMLWLRCLRLFTEWVRCNSYGWNILLPCDSI